MKSMPGVWSGFFQSIPRLALLADEDSAEETRQESVVEVVCLYIV